MTLPRDATRPIGILYATREGHSHRIADHVAAALRGRGLAVIVAHVADDDRRVVVDELGMVIAIASVHGGRFEPEMVDFARRHASTLTARPAAFVAVSLSEAVAEDLSAPPGVRAAATEDVQRSLDRFFEETGWHPARVLPVAGCVAYTRYGFLKRHLVRRVVAARGGPTDVSRDHELTDWGRLDRFIRDVVARAEQRGAGLRHV